jgi:ribosomal protein S18 acetylase RimI-like enzyme
VKIRTHSSGDFGWIISIHGEVYTREFGFDDSFEINIADKIVKYFAKKDVFNRIWIAEIENKRVGSIAIRLIADNVGFINFVAVLEEFRGNGIADALMREVIRHAYQHEISKLRLETYTCLVSARELYKKLGFNIVESAEIKQFGQELVREFWELPLLPD